MIGKWHWCEMFGCKENTPMSSGSRMVSKVLLVTEMREQFQGLQRSNLSQVRKYMKTSSGSSTSNEDGSESADESD